LGNSLLQVEGSKMRQILIASHGHLASGIKSSINILTGIGDQISIIDAYVDDRDYTEDIVRFIEESEDDAVIFSDLYGGSVNQRIMSKILESKKDIYLISNTNLAIVLELLMYSEKLTEKVIKDKIADSPIRYVETTISDDVDEDDFFA
jgi:PTS system mannose-specific IIA component